MEQLLKLAAVERGKFFVLKAILDHQTFISSLDSLTK
jgi:hypothetical protein